MMILDNNALRKSKSSFLKMVFYSFNNESWLLYFLIDLWFSGHFQIILVGISFG